ncbi:MAG: hypothetical protein BGO43_00090 [Gammaproteobacteria bacterium 39-13]|nr:hypothetical protein [Gammaproteobacteria bacterium]OJV96666.1 MAG: hypothetical protein BGO43_00090 [Gammaproteobacteria bacterium 39-13]
MKCFNKKRMLRTAFFLFLWLNGIANAVAPSHETINLNQKEKVIIPPLSGYAFITQPDNPIFKHFEIGCCEDKQAQNALLGVGIPDAELALNLSEAKKMGIENPFSRYIAFEKLGMGHENTLSPEAWDLRRKETKKAFLSIYKGYSLTDLNKERTKVKKFKLDALTENRQLMPLGYIEDKNLFSTFTITHITPTDTKTTALSKSEMTGYSITQLYLYNTVLTLIVHRVVNEISDLEKLVAETNEIAEQLFTLNKG